MQPESGGTKSANFLATESVSLSANYKTKNMVTIILELQNEEREIGQRKVWTHRQS